MKKNYLFTVVLTILISTITFGQDLLITGAIDGPLPGGFPKGIELYAINEITDLSIYGLESTTNGAVSAGQEYTFPADNIAAGTYIYVGNTGANSASLFMQYLGVTPQYLDGVMGINGDDTVILYKNGTIEDLLGRIGEDGSGKDWDHLDGWAYRKDGSAPNATFDSSEWTFSGANAIDGCDKSDDTGTNAECSSVFPVGTYTEVASTTPEITAIGDDESFDYFEGFGPSAEQEFTIEGTNLTDDITLTAPVNFEVSLTSGSGFVNSLTITQTDGSASANIYVRLAAGLNANTYTGTISATSAGATDLTGNFEGVVSPANAQFSIIAFLNDFNYVATVGGPSPEQTFSVQGLFLTNDLVVTAPTNFEVSLTSGLDYANSVSISPNSGTVAETTVYVRLKGSLSAANYTGDITVSSTDIADQTISVNGDVFGAVTNSLIITGAYDGSLTGGTPKGIEIFVLNDIADLSAFGVSSVSNGGGSTAGNVEFVFPNVAVTSGTFIYISTEDTNFNTFFGMMPTYTTGTVGINGDDSIELYENGQIIDVFGDVNKDGSGEVWDHLDGWAYRKSNTGPEGTKFTTTNWTYSGVDGLEGGTNNATATKPFPIGTYTNTTASVKNSSIEGFATYPNPVTNNSFTITSNSTDQKEVKIFNVLGKQVFSSNFSGSNFNVNIPTISAGLYILKVTEGTKTATSKLVIK